MQTNNWQELPQISCCYGSLTSFLRKFDRYSRKRAFQGETPEEFEAWKEETRTLLRSLLGLEKMETCSLEPETGEVCLLDGGITREHVRIQVEPEVWLTMYLLIPSPENSRGSVFLCPPGHNGAGKYSVAGLREYRLVEEKIDGYQYDYGYQLARMGYVAVCPDCRGFGERREEPEDAADPVLGLKGDCYALAHMGEPLGIPVAGMLTWDLMRIVDYLYERGEWDVSDLRCLGFSGGGMQTLWLSALDERIRMSVISGYMYGFRDSLLILNKNCSCNYVPHLWEYVDMGDIASLIAPRPLLIQSCREDRLNGPRGIENAVEQVQIIRKAYGLYRAENRLFHEICEGGHRWHGENLETNLRRIQHL